jgi:hypothetical protein
VLDLVDHPAADRRVERGHVPEERGDDAEPDLPATGLERGRDLAVGFARDDHRVRLHDLVREVGTRMAEPDDQDRPVGELRRIAVLARMELPDRWIELLGKGGHRRALERAGRDDDLTGLVAPLAGNGDERLPVAARPFEALDADAGVGPEAEVVDVGLEVVGELGAGRERPLRHGVRQPRQFGVAGR